MRFLFKKKDAGADDNITVSDRLYSSVYWISEKGPVRSHNEDSVSVSFLTRDKQNLVAVLADGMGGHNAGEVASRMACDCIEEYVLQHHEQETAGKLLENAVRSAHKRIAAAGMQNIEQQGMGTTAIVTLVKDGKLYFGHIGDSRMYQYHNGGLTQLTRDQTLVNNMYENGEITKSERDAHPVRNVLLQALGGTAEIAPQVLKEGVTPTVGDRFLVCSDGLYDVCSDPELEELLRMGDPVFILECIRCLATYRNASDNFSVIIISFANAPLQATSITREQNTMV